MSSSKPPPDAVGARNPFAEDFVPAPVRPAATILLCRRGGKHADRDLEVLMVQRNPGARFMPGVWVFPGGSVDANELIAGVAGGETDVDADELAHRAAAIRELFEEATIQLALDTELILWARWITPEPIPIRFDTRFYLALAPAHTPPKADGSEVVDARWVNPAKGLEQFKAGDLDLAFPTVKQLETLLPYRTSDDLMAAAREMDVEPIMPIVVQDEESDEGWRMLMPGDEGYTPPNV